MSATLISPIVESSDRILSLLRERINNHFDILEVASNLGVTPSTLRKILAGRPISRFIKKKIGPILEGKEERVSINRKRYGIERLRDAYHLYQQKKTLQGVGDEMGLSRERVRQLLVNGAAVGLFEYKPLYRMDISREKLLDDYERLLSLKAVAQANKTSISCLYRLCKLNYITDHELEERKIAGWKRLCIERYDTAVRRLGRHPTTTELQQMGLASSLLRNIRKLWGSIHTFRRECGISGFFLSKGLDR
ncbi:MAG: hypothetical protein MPW15_26710 [Candidatus Manganitrophus sp.]|nr:hypothetical protein [Candidatus Manganitrophus sp.]